MDVVKVEEVNRIVGTRYYHFGVYLGNNEICHFTSGIDGARKTDWSGFLEDQVGKLHKYHPVVPFKHCEKIARQISWALDTKYREDCYDLLNRNCEHFVKILNIMIKKKNELKIAVGGYDVGTVEETVKLIEDKLAQLKLNFSGPVFFPNRRVVVTAPTSPHKHKNAQEKFGRTTHWRKFFVTIPANLAPSTLKNLLNVEVPGRVNLKFVLPSDDDKPKKG